MKITKLNLFSVLVLALLIIVGCKKEVPKDVPAMKAAINEKKAEIKTLQGDIEKLLEEIEKLEPTKEKEAVLVSTQTVNKGEFKRFTTIQGVVATDEKVFLSSEIGGRLLSVRAKEGDNVSKGQLLATVDTKVIEDQKTEILTALDLAKEVYERQKRLWEQNIGSEIQYLQAKNGVERLEKSLTTINSQLSKANIYSPISGVVDMELIKPGEIVGPGQPILQILNVNKLKVMADVPENYIGSVKKGDKVEVYFPAIDKQIAANVALLGRTIDPSNRTFKIEVNTSSLNGVLKPNLLAELKFNDFTAKDAISIPLNLVQQEVSGKKYVFTTIEKEGTLHAKKTYISIGEGAENSVIATEGLGDGDRLIVEGARSVTDGDKVKDISKE